MGKPSSAMDGQVVFPWVLQFLLTFDEHLAQYK